MQKQKWRGLSRLSIVQVLSIIILYFWWGPIDRLWRYQVYRALNRGSTKRMAATVVLIVVWIVRTKSRNIILIESWTIFSPTLFTVLQQKLAIPGTLKIRTSKWPSVCVCVFRCTPRAEDAVIPLELRQQRIHRFVYSRKKYKRESEISENKK